MKNIGRSMKLGVLAIILTPFLLVSCFEEDDTDYAKLERQLLEKYLTDNNITVEPTESGLYFIQGDTGTGPFAEIGDTISIYYAGFTLEGQIIATNIESVAIEYNVEEYFTDYDPFVFKLGEPGNVVPGIEEGLTYMNEGSTATLIIPSDIGIPGSYTTLRYEIEMLEVRKPVVK
jgi:FKBP-type peptidyl-prolyl cis-trans isomerase FkpA